MTRPKEDGLSITHREGETQPHYIDRADYAWAERALRRHLPVGHCGESSSEAIARGRAEDRVDRILQALAVIPKQGREGPAPVSPGEKT